MAASIIFDFDGTLAIGHGPVLAYADEAAAFAGTDFRSRVDAALADFDRGDRTYRDGYDVVGSLAAADGVDEDTLSGAYQRSRLKLGTAAAPVETIEDLAGFLAALAPHAELILATNAPEHGLHQVLDSWGVRERFDAVHVNVGKPLGLVDIARRARARGPVLAIGDIVEFDLAPAWAMGADTVLVGATAFDSAAPVTMRGSSLAEMRDGILSWAQSRSASDSSASSSAPLPSPTTESRLS